MPKRPAKPSPNSVQVQRNASGSAWVFSHPKAVREMAEDLEEVRGMIAAGEGEIAVDELRWLLADCSDFLEAHNLLGELALEISQDIPLARGHFGYAYQLGEKAIRRAECRGPLPGDHPANAPFFAAAQGLAWCLEKLGQPDKANEVVALVKQLDPRDPLGVANAVEELRTKGLPIVELGGGLSEG